MKFREADLSDIEQMHIIRNSVRENILSDPSKVSVEDYKKYLTNSGKGWVCEVENKIVGFSIVDLVSNNVWALFVHPEFEAKGIGRRLYEIMLNWYFGQTQQSVWLSTSPNTRAEKFYRKSGWT